MTSLTMASEFFHMGKGPRDRQSSPKGLIIPSELETPQDSSGDREHYRERHVSVYLFDCCLYNKTSNVQRKKDGWIN